MSEINLRIRVPSELKPEGATGLLLSFLTMAQEIASGTRKAGYFRHFWKERLSRSERRLLTQFLNTIISELSEKIGRKPKTLTEERPLEDSQIPEVLLRVLDSFRQI